MSGPLFRSVLVKNVKFSDLGSSGSLRDVRVLLINCLLTVENKRGENQK